MFAVGTIAFLIAALLTHGWTQFTIVTVWGLLEILYVQVHDRFGMETAITAALVGLLYAIYLVIHFEWWRIGLGLLLMVWERVQ